MSKTRPAAQATSNTGPLLLGLAGFVAVAVALWPRSASASEPTPPPQPAGEPAQPENGEPPYYWLRASVVLGGFSDPALTPEEARARNEELAASSASGKAFRAGKAVVYSVLAATGYGAIIAAAAELLFRFADWVTPLSSGGFDRLPLLTRARWYLESRGRPLVTTPPQDPRKPQGFQSYGGERLIPDWSNVSASLYRQYCKELIAYLTDQLRLKRIIANPDDWVPDPRLIKSLIEANLWPTPNRPIEFGYITGDKPSDASIYWLAAAADLDRSRLWILAEEYLIISTQYMIDIAAYNAIVTPMGPKPSDVI